jgi:hypothetical protein
MELVAMLFGWLFDMNLTLGALSFTKSVPDSGIK